mgnify:CR=1 FL=1
MKNIDFGFVVLSNDNMHVIVDFHTFLKRGVFRFLFIYIALTSKKI